MYLIIVRTKMRPEKRTEMLQTIASLVNSTRTIEGCSTFDSSCNLNDQSELILFGEWETQEALDGYLQSELFKVLLGAMDLLERSHQITFYTRLPSPQQMGLEAGEKTS